MANAGGATRCGALRPGGKPVQNLWQKILAPLKKEVMAHPIRAAHDKRESKIKCRAMDEPSLFILRGEDFLRQIL